MKLKDYTLLVGSGPTREWIDPVRYISNASSGKTGWFLAVEGLTKFKKVIYITGPSDSKFRTVSGAVNIQVETTDEMCREILNALDNKMILIMAAAPADFTPLKSEIEKIKKDSEETTIQLKKTEDILMNVSEKAKVLHDFISIGFAAETENLIDYAKLKLKKKNLNFICANTVYKNQIGFGDNDNAWIIIGKNGKQIQMGPAPKSVLAAELISFLDSHINSSPEI